MGKSSGDQHFPAKRIVGVDIFIHSEDTQLKWFIVIVQNGNNNSICINLLYIFLFFNSVK